MREAVDKLKGKREEDQQVVIAVTLLDEENQGRRRGSQVDRGPNVDRHRHFRVMHDICNYDAYFVQKCDVAGVDEIARMVKSTMLEALQGDYRNRKCQKSIIFEAVAGFDTWVWHAFFRVAGSQNNLNVLGQSPVFNDVLKVEAPNITYQINNTIYQTGYYLADGIYPRWTTFVKSILNPPILEAKIICFISRRIQERCRKVFWHPPTSVVDCTEMARMFDEEVLRSIMMTCIIFHNMIVEDEYDNGVVEVYEPDPMNTALRRIYKRLVGPSREPLEQEPLVRDGRFMTRD
ncbi:unnamed protein product [Prunus armeniaca]